MTNDDRPADLAPWLVAYVAEQAQPERVAAWVERVRAAIVSEIPEVNRIDDFETALPATIRAHWVAFLADFAQPAQHFHLVDEAGSLAAGLAERQVPLEVLIRIYRVAQQEVWHYVREVIKELPEGQLDHADILIHFWNRAGIWLDKSITESIDIYQSARTRTLAGATAQRFEAARAVLAGEVDDPRAASAGLGGYPMSVRHTALVLSVADAERAGTLDALASDLARALGVANPLVVKPGGRQLWLWLGTRDAPDLDRLPGLAAQLSHDGVVIGVGSPSEGIAGFAASHREALGALGVARPDGGAWLRLYADAELELLLGCSPEVDRFMERQLGALAADGDEGMARVRETVLTYLDNGGNAEETARLLVVHRNTVRYRLGQAEELIGHPIGKFSSALAVALRHQELFHS